MNLLLALFLVVHASIHMGYICGPAWPFAATDPWLVTVLGANGATVRGAGIALATVSFVAFLLAAVTVAGLGRTLRMPLVIVAALASMMVLILFVTPWTLPGIAIDAALLWAVLDRHPRPTRSLPRARRAAEASQAADR